MCFSCAWHFRLSQGDCCRCGGGGYSKRITLLTFLRTKGTFCEIPGGDSSECPCKGFIPRQTNVDIMVYRCIPAHWSLFVVSRGWGFILLANVLENVAAKEKWNAQHRPRFRRSNSCSQENRYVDMLEWVTISIAIPKAAQWQGGTFIERKTNTRKVKDLWLEWLKLNKADRI